MTDATFATTLTESATPSGPVPATDYPGAVGTEPSPEEAGWVLGEEAQRLAEDRIQNPDAHVAPPPEDEGKQ